MPVKHLLSENGKLYADGVRVSTLYTFGMPKYVHVQLIGLEKAAVIEADKVERETSTSGGSSKLVLKKGAAEVGEFRTDQVAGWWIAERD